MYIIRRKLQPRTQPVYKIVGSRRNVRDLAYFKMGTSLRIERACSDVALDQLGKYAGNGGERFVVLSTKRGPYPL